MKKILLFGILASLLILPMVLASNLMIKDLEDISLEGLTVKDYSGSFQDNCLTDGEPYVNMIFEIRSYEGIDALKFTFSLGEGDFTANPTTLGENWIGKNVIVGYIDKEEISEELPIVLRMNTDCIADIKEGDYITLTYDGGQVLDVYLPGIKDYVFMNFFIAEDGSTYHDDALTELIATKPKPIYYKVGETVGLPFIETSETSDLDFSDGIGKYVYCSYHLDAPNTDDKCQGYDTIRTGDCDTGSFVPLAWVGAFEYNHTCGLYELASPTGAHVPLAINLTEGTTVWAVSVVSADMIFDETIEDWILGEVKEIDSLTVTYKTIPEPSDDFMRTLIQALLGIICKIYPFAWCPI